MSSVSLRDKVLAANVLPTLLVKLSANVKLSFGTLSALYYNILSYLGTLRVGLDCWTLD